MAEIKKEMIKNGDRLYPFYTYKCEYCGADIPENTPYVKIGSRTFACGDCAFKNGLISEKEYIKIFLYFVQIDGLRASVRDGKIHVTTSKFPWEKTSRDRDCKEYKEWRKSVFDRDKYTCVRCGQVGGKLNAHHIKEYSKYPKLRYVLKNGITLCEKCHREVHKKRGEHIG